MKTKKEIRGEIHTEGKDRGTSKAGGRGGEAQEGKSCTLTQKESLLVELQYKIFTPASAVRDWL